jgi:uncharacterized membrane protein
MAARDLFNAEQVKDIEAAIMGAEKKTSGEIRVFVEETVKDSKDVLNRAAEVFKELDLHKARHQNGTLFYLATQSRKFAVIGDEGIHQAAPPNFWESIKDNMQTLFRDGKFAEGLIEGITMAGDALIKYFPHERDDENDLPDEVVFG